MSRKPAKKQPADKPATTMEDLKMIEATLKDSKTKMKQRVEHGIEHIKNLLETTSKKFLTVNGMMACFDCFRDIKGKLASDYMNDLHDAACAASILSKDMLAWVEKVPNAEETIADPNALDEMIGRFYCHDFTSVYLEICDQDDPVFETVLEIQRTSICQQIGPVAEEITQFIDNQQHEIENVADTISHLRERMGLDEGESAKIIELPSKE